MRAITHINRNGLSNHVEFDILLQPPCKLVGTLVTRIDNPWLLLATLPLFHPVQALKMTPLLQFTPIHFPKSTPLPLFTPVCNFEALLVASFILNEKG